MHSRTESTINELAEKDWFSRVGKLDSDRVIFFDSWNEAIASCEADNWTSLLEESANQYRARIAERNRERFIEWNRLVREIKEFTMPFVEKKIEQVVRANGLPISFVHAVQWDILHLCMESEYADVFPPGFYASQAYWYSNGHFPCGWRGDFPNGKICVY